MRMDNNALRDNFRKQLTNVHALTVLTVSLFEIIGYIVLIGSGMEELSLRNRYFWLCVVLPIFVNVLTHLIARRIVSHSNAARNRKNAVIIAAALITSFVVAVLHKEYIITSCAFVFPMMLSAMFNDKKLLNASFACSLFILLCVGIAFELDKSASLVSRLNLLILFGFAIVAYFCSTISINFSRLNSTTIQTQAQDNSRLRDDVLRDQMTGLYNHSAFVSGLDRLLEKADETEAFCLAMIDIDDFKKINDTFGHDCGDEVLIYLADTLSRHCGAGVTPYRYGGEEFAILFAEKRADEACDVMQAILSTFRSHTFSFTARKITFSSGVAEYKCGLTKSEFFEQADQTLYRAKHEGKNRVLKAE